MDLQYIKRAFQLLREDPLQTTISILGSAFAIVMIISQLMSDRAEIMNYPPEIHREKTLYLKWAVTKEKETDKIISSGYFSPKMIDECFRTLESPQYVVASMPVEVFMASIPGVVQKKCYVRSTDDVFWKAHPFKFIEGTPYSKADFDAGIKKIILSRKFSKKLLGFTENIVGKQIQLDYETYTISGVVEDISPLLNYTFAQAWIPFTSLSRGVISGDKEGVTGNLKCEIIPYSASDIRKIRSEIDEKIKQYNSSLSDVYVDLYGQPDRRFKETKRGGWGDPNMREKYIKHTATILLVFLVPAINLSGFMLSRMRKRMPELGIRKAFGSTRNGVLRQIISENILYSLIGGIVGLCLSCLTLYLIKGKYAFTSNIYGMDVDLDVPFMMLFNWENFLMAFGFCLVMNLLSACIPAWRVSSAPIVESLREQ